MLQLVKTTVDHLYVVDGPVRVYVRDLEYTDGFHIYYPEDSTTWAYYGQSIDRVQTAATRKALGMSMPSWCEDITEDFESPENE